MTTIHKKHDHICTHADTFDVSSLQNDDNDDDDVPARVKSQANFVREKNRTRTK